MKSNDIKSDTLTVLEAGNRLADAIRDAKQQKYKVIKIHHGYGSTGIGGSIKVVKSELSEEKQKFIQTYLNRITKVKHKKVIWFFSDYFEFLDQAARVSNQYIVMTLGNRTVNRVKINLAKITEKYLESKGFIRKDKLSRKITSKKRLIGFL